MPFKPPLTQETLKEIQNLNFHSEDVRTLLWEVKRLRALVLYMDQLQRMLGSLSGPQGALLEMIRSQLQDEPCVKESPRLPPGA